MSLPDQNRMRAQFAAARDVIREFRRLREDPQTDETVRANAGKALAALRSELGPEAPVGNRGVFLPPHGGYRDLEAFKNAEYVYDATVFFCDKYIDRFSRTKDQMVQAARSGRQNIAEGSAASGTSKEMELKLVNVARASLEELLLDYEDFLRQRGLPLWGKEHPRAKKIRKLAYVEDKSYETYKSYIEALDPETAANAILCLIHQTCYLLNQLITQLEKAFLAEGGLRERMTRARIEARKQQRDHGS
jgi:four helix bundle suffix protein